MNTTQIAILDTLNTLNLVHKKRYCYPSQVKILALLEKHHDIHIKRRALNYALAGLQAAGLIHRFRRHEKTDEGQLYLRSTAYYIAKKAKKLGTYLVALGRRAARGFAVQLIAHNNDTKRIISYTDKVCPVDKWGATPLSEIKSKLTLPF